MHGLVMKTTMIRGLFLFNCAVCSVFGQEGATIYANRCASCHDAGAGRVPPLSALKAMSLPAILQALESGSMQAQANGLSSADRVALAIYLSIPAAKPVSIPDSGRCPGDAHAFRDS